MFVFPKYQKLQLFVDSDSACEMYTTMQSYELTTYKHDILTTTSQSESITSLTCFIFCCILSLFLRYVLTRNKWKTKQLKFSRHRKVNFPFLEYLCDKEKTKQIISFVSPFLHFPLYSVNKTWVSWRDFPLILRRLEPNSRKRLSV